MKRYSLFNKFSVIEKALGMYNIISSLEKVQNTEAFNNWKIFRENTIQFLLKKLINTHSLKKNWIKRRNREGFWQSWIASLGPLTILSFFLNTVWMTSLVSIWFCFFLCFFSAFYLCKKRPRSSTGDSQNGLFVWILRICKLLVPSLTFLHLLLESVMPFENFC